MKRDAHREAKAVGRRKLRNNRSSRYPIEQSPLWRLSSVHRLAKLLSIPAESLDAMCLAPEYHRFDDPGKDGRKLRHIQEPTGSTLVAHYRIVNLLDRIQRPDFLHSATKRRSHITNALAHADTGGAVIGMDIRDFFESTTYHHVKDFFNKDLSCSHDVSRLLANLCTADRHLPTGSCISPLLSYLTHRSLFLAIERLCKEKAVTMTLYVDDLTLSGTHATKSMLFEIKDMIRKRGLQTKSEKDAIVRPGKAAIITGVVRSRSNLRLRNKQHHSIVMLQDAVCNSTSSEASESLAGKMAAARAVDPNSVGRLSERLLRISARGNVVHGVATVEISKRR